MKNFYLKPKLFESLKGYSKKQLVNDIIAGVIVAIPVTAVFLMLQKYYVEGVTGGAVKG